MNAQKLYSEINRLQFKCTCGCEFNESCLCKDKREGYEQAKKDIKCIINYNANPEQYYQRLNEVTLSKIIGCTVEEFRTYNLDLTNKLALQQFILNKLNEKKTT